MAKRKKIVKEEIKPNFVLTLKLDTENYQGDILDKRLDIGRRIYNALSVPGEPTKSSTNPPLT